MEKFFSRLKSIDSRLLVAGGLAIIAVVGFFLVNGTTPQAQKVKAGPHTVKVFKGDLVGSLTADGTLKPERDVSLSMDTTGIVKTVDVRVGDQVKAGQMLLQLDDGIARQNVEKADLAAQLAQVNLDTAQHDLNSKVGWSPNGSQLNAAQAEAANAEAAVKAAQSDYDQVAWVPWVSSTQQSLTLEQATNNYNKAKADLDYLYSNRPDITLARDTLQAAKLSLSTSQLDLQMAKDMLAKMTLVAPFDGTISAVNVDQGEAASGPVVEMVTMDRLEVIVNVDQVDIGSLDVGQPAVIIFDAWPGVQVKGKVWSIYPQASTADNVVNFEVHLALDKTDLELRSGITGHVAIQTFNLTGVLLVPNQALVLDPQTGQYHVSVMTPQGPKQSGVTIGKRDDKYTEILDGLKEGDELLTDSPAEVPTAQSK